MRRRTVLRALGGATCLASVPRAQYLFAFNDTDVVQRRRVALVVGNNEYKFLDPLYTPREDALAVGRMLRSMGYSLLNDRVHLDVSGEALQVLVARIADAVNANDVLLFYFAGHGFSQAERGYLAGVDFRFVPGAKMEQVDAPLGIGPGESRVMPTQALSVDLALSILDRSKSVVNIAILDACRDPKTIASTQLGLAQCDPPKRTLISYSTQPGNVALDSSVHEPSHSPYAAALIGAMATPDSTVLEVFNDVGRKVQETTEHEQVPWVSLSPIPSRFRFSDLPVAVPSPPHVTCPTDIESMAAPIRNLFDAWRGLDLTQYGDQLHPQAFQVTRKIQRDKSGILAQRSKLFARLLRVEVLATNIRLESVVQNRAVFINTYTMRFVPRNGKTIEEVGVVERYTVICSEQKRWTIIENLDYLE